MSTDTNNNISIQDVQKIITLGGLETFNEQLKKWINQKISDDTITPVINITYSELKSLRDNSKLTPGQQYRITDYVTTTAQQNTQSAGHQFDIIVTVDDVNVLNENARAIQHEEDIYFANSDLNAWKIWYCLDNDSNRYSWADAENGKGVIYRMIDEFNNDCPYDFKNIQFTHPNKITTYSNYYYTFSVLTAEIVSDHSFNGSYCYGNKIGQCVSDGKQSLNQNVFINTNETSYCHSNSFGNFCHHNSFGNDCYSNSFGNDCYSNSFGNLCYSNRFGNACYSNDFNNSCYYNSFGNNCYSNNLGRGCYTNSFGNSCQSNIFGNYCVYNNFGNSCSSNSFGSTDTSGNYFAGNSFGDDVRYVSLVNDSTASANNRVQYYRVANGTQGQGGSIIIEVDRNKSVETYIGMSTDGEVKQFCLVDMVDALSQITIIETN